MTCGAGGRCRKGPGTAVAVSRRWEMVEMGGREECGLLFLAISHPKIEFKIHIGTGT